MFFQEPWNFKHFSLNTKKILNVYSHQVWVSFRLREGSFRLQLNKNMNENLKMNEKMWKSKRNIRKQTEFFYLSIYLAYINLYLSIQ